MWSDPEKLETITKVATWGAAVLGLLAGLAGVVAVVASARADRLKEELKRTPPQVGASLTYGSDGLSYVVIESQTRVPFECTWTIVTKNNVLLSGIMLGENKVYPTKVPYRVKYRVDFDARRAVDEYIELRLNYRSIYAAELQLPALAGAKIRVYRVSATTKEIAPA